MTVFRRRNGWAAKYVHNGRQRWVPGSPWRTRAEAAAAERQDRGLSQERQDQAAAAVLEAWYRKLRARPHTVYLLFAGDELIYVGITSEGLRRLGKHREQKSWWQEVTRATFEHVESAEAAEALESKLIAEQHPRYNKRGRVEPLPPGRLGVEQLGEHLRYAPQTVRKLADEGLLPVAGRTERGTPYFSLEDVEAWCRAGKAARLPLDPNESRAQSGSCATDNAEAGGE